MKIFSKVYKIFEIIVLGYINIKEDRNEGILKVIIWCNLKEYKYNNIYYGWVSIFVLGNIVVGVYF